MKKIKNYFAVAKVNFKYTTWIAYLVSGIFLLAMAVDLIIDKKLQMVGESSIAFYSMGYLVCLLAPIFIASVNYPKLSNIGVKKKQYFFGCIINYVVFALLASIFGVLEHYFLDDLLSSNGTTIYGLIHIFGWDSNFIIAFLSQFSFLVLVQSIIHTLTFIQTKWYGWLADVTIVVIISVFTPIPALRSVLSFFFNIIIFSSPAIQIPACIVLAILFYMTNLFYLKKRI